MISFESHGCVRLAVLTVLVTFFMAGLSMAAGQSGPAAAFPDNESGWKPMEEPVTVEGEDLFTLINGGAEAYLQLGFKQAASVAFSHSSGKTIQVEIYEMNDAGGAKASFERMAGGQKPNIEIGDGAYLADYYLLIHQGPYFISLAGTEPDAETVEGLKILAGAILSNLR